MPRELNGGFANFYDSLALYPEVGKYRCFGANWSKRLYDDIEEVIQKQDALNKALARKWKATNEADGGATLLDVPRSFVSKEEVEIKEKWGQYEEALTKYSENPWNFRIKFMSKTLKVRTSCYLNRYSTYLVMLHMPTSIYANGNSSILMAILDRPERIGTDTKTRHIKPIPVP